MNTSDKPLESARPWWLALVALAVMAPWPGWVVPVWAAAAMSAGLFVLARPRGRQRLGWMAVALCLAAAALPKAGGPQRLRLSEQFDRHVSDMLGIAEEVGSDPAMRRLFAASGEALDPSRPFSVLDRRVRDRVGRSAYLADDRGRLVAWGGDQRAYPSGVRPLGERRFGVVWSATRAVIFVREPVMMEGRLVGSVTVSDQTPLVASELWGMRAPRGFYLVLGRGGEAVQSVATPSGGGLELPVGLRALDGSKGPSLRWIGWLVLACCTIAWRPFVGGATVLVGSTAYLVAPGEPTWMGLVVVLLLSGAAVGRLGRRLAPAPARMLIVVAVGSAAGIATFTLGGFFSWLPDHLVQPGWGGVWMVALAWAVSGWPALARKGVPSLALRLFVASALALLALCLEIARIPVELARAGDLGSGVVLPREELDLAAVLPVPPRMCLLDDAAPAVARQWKLDRWRTPSELLLVDDNGFELSRWGDLAPAGDAVRRVRSWPLADPPGTTLELRVATGPWSWLADWRSGEALAKASSRSVWFASLTRSGSVVATLHNEIADLDAVSAGEIFHAGGGWTRLTVGGGRYLSRLRRQGDLLVVAVGRYPVAVVWALRTAVASIWALAGLLIACPPVLRREQLATFGGRLRVLVAGGVVLPLVVLTLILQLRFQRDERRIEREVGLNALSAARYISGQLGGEYVVNDELARWISAGWGGEVVLFDGADVVAVSRPDLMSTGVLPDLPAARAFPSFLIGRDDPMVFREDGRLVAAGPVVLQGRLLLLELIRVDPQLRAAAPDAADWLLTGALLAALLTFVLTSRIERRLSVSLRDLVSMARRLLDGEPLGHVRRPVETDLAEVLDAVRSMNEEVQRRETSLRHQEELLRITLSTLAPAVVVLEASGELRFANPSAEHLQEAHGDLLLEIVRGLTDREGDEGIPVVETLRPLPGRDLSWRVGVVGVPLPDGSRGLVAVVDDVTEEVRVERLRQLNQLARIVAHEVKNPLTPVRLWVQELEEARRRNDPELDQLLGEACREISIQVDRLQDTANSFSNLVALERWETEPIDLVEVVEETLVDLTIFDRRGIRLIRELPDAGSCRVRADRQWLQRALGNLVKNSIDALGDCEGEVVVRVARDEDRVTIEVEDSAGGIPQEKLQDLFSPHFSTTTAGSGLGLALVHQVVSRCQGRISAFNGDRGLVVRIELPST